jgi:bacteriocin-like protein
MVTKTETKRVTLRRESLRDLSATELQQVIGGSQQCGAGRPPSRGFSASCAE